MSGIRKIAYAVPAAVMCLAAGAICTQLNARESGGTVSPRQAVLAAVDQETKDLLALIDTDKNGRISKREFLSFMEAEFDRLDKDRGGELDIRELSQSQLAAESHRFETAGK